MANGEDPPLLENDQHVRLTPGMLKILNRQVSCLSVCLSVSLSLSLSVSVCLMPHVYLTLNGSHHITPLYRLFLY